VSGKTPKSTQGEYLCPSLMWQLKLPSLWNWKPGKHTLGAPAAIRNRSLFATVHTAEASSHLLFLKRRKRKPLIYANANTRTTNHTVTVRTKVCLSFSKKLDLLKRSGFLFLNNSLSKKIYSTCLPRNGTFGMEIF
jgi:hypothetical protein